MDNIKSVAKKVEKKLLEAGFIVQRYNAYSTNSIYLKADYGMCNSIRISDHRGKQHLDYRYNLSSHANSRYIDRSGTYPQYFYPFAQWHIMVEAVKKRRCEKIAKLGELGYEREMLEYKAKHENNRGFWEQAYLVTKEG